MRPVYEHQYPSNAAMMALYPGGGPIAGEGRIFIMPQIWGMVELTDREDNGLFAVLAVNELGRQLLDAMDNLEYYEQALRWLTRLPLPDKSVDLRVIPEAIVPPALPARDHPNPVRVSVENVTPGTVWSVMANTDMSGHTFRGIVRTDGRILRVDRRFLEPTDTVTVDGNENPIRFHGKGE